MDRSLIPTISAACHHVILFTMARKITSCTFIARSIAASYPRRPNRDNSPCYLIRSYHVLTARAKNLLDKAHKGILKGES
jgi:hypothetical protein